MYEGTLTRQARRYDLSYLRIVGGDHDIVSLLVKAGTDVNEKDAQGMMPLMWAALTHKTQVVQTLLALGANALDVSKHGQTALAHASDIRHHDSETEAVLKSAMKLQERQVN